MTVLETGQIMDILVTAYPRFYAGKDAPDQKKTLQLWATMFAEYPLAVVAGAVKALIATDEKGFPPHIGAVMAKIRQLTQDKPMTEQEAWALVKKAVSRSGYNSREEFDKLPPEIQAVLHDAGTLKAWAIDENYNEGVVSSNFMRSYRAKAQSIREWSALPEDVKRIAIDAGGGFTLPEPVKAAERKRRLEEGAERDV